MNIAKNHNKIVNIFMVYSPLHCLCAELIVRCFEADARNFIFYIKEGLNTCLNHDLWDDIVFHPWPRFKPEPGIFGRVRRTQNNLRLVASYCENAKQIRLHTVTIDTESINYHINYLRKQFPAANFSVRLTPDGTLNLTKHPQGWIREMLKYARLSRKIINSNLHYHVFKGDRIGSDNDVVDRIYTLHGFSHEYDQNKVVELPPFIKGDCSIKKYQLTKRALVIGQPLLSFRLTTEKETEVIKKHINDIICLKHIDKIYYKSHPRENGRELAMPSYTELYIDEPLEKHLLSNQYDIVIGVSSTALLTSRMVLPKWCEVISVGMNLLKFKTKRIGSKMLITFNNVGVRIIDIS